MKKYMFLSMLLAWPNVFQSLSYADNNSSAEFISLSRRPTPQFELPTNVAIVTAKDIEKMGANTLTDVLENLVGMDVSRSGSLGSLSTLRVRGATTADQIQIVVDDQPLGGVSIQNINIDLIPTGNIERIEIVRGGASVLYGANTIGGVIHIFTKKSVSLPIETSVGIESGSLKTRRVRGNLGIQKDRTNGNFFVSGYNTDGFQDNADVKNRDASGNLGYSFQNGTQFNIGGSVTRRELGSPNGTPVPFDEWNGKKERTPNSLTQRIENNVNRFRTQGTTPFFQKGNLQTAIYHSRETYKLRLQTGTDPIATFDNRIWGQDTRLVLDQGTTLGLSLERNERESLGQLPHHISNWGSYLQHEIQTGRWIFNPGLRFDQHSAYGNQWNPRLSVVYRQSPKILFSANAARAYRSPTLVDLYIVATDPFFPAFDFFGNSNLKPEKATTYDWGFSVTPHSQLELKTTGFFTTIRDRIDSVDTDGNGNVDTLRNFSKAQIIGMECEGRIKTGTIEHQTKLTLQRAKGTSANSTQYEALRLTPRYLFNYQQTLPLKNGIEIINSFQSVGSQFELDRYQGVRLAPYTLWNARINKNSNWGTIFFSAQNITDKRFAESVTFGNAVPQPGRLFNGGIELRFPKKPIF